MHSDDDDDDDDEVLSELESDEDTVLTFLHNECVGNVWLVMLSTRFRFFDVEVIPNRDQ